MWVQDGSDALLLQRDEEIRRKGWRRCGGVSVGTRSSFERPHEWYEREEMEDEGQGLAALCLM